MPEKNPVSNNNKKVLFVVLIALFFVIIGLIIVIVNMNRNYQDDMDDTVNSIETETEVNSEKNEETPSPDIPTPPIISFPQ